MRKLKQQKNTGFTPLNTSRRERQSRYLTGFTLLEMIVAVGVFMVVVTISLTAFLNVHDIQLKMSAFRAASDNVNFAIETMVREIEEGRCIKQDGSLRKCNGADGTYEEIEFHVLDEITGGFDKEITYKKFTCNTPNPLNHQCIQRKEGGGAWSDITSDNVNITYLNFNIQNSNPLVYDISDKAYTGDTNQPLITITVEGEAGDKLKSKINIQASASMRQLDVVYTP